MHYNDFLKGFLLLITDLIKKFEKAVTIRLSQIKEGTKSVYNRPEHVLNASTIEGTTKDVQTEKQTTIEKTEEKSQAGLSVGSEAKEITFESFLQGLKLKKDLHFGKISEQSWKSNKPIITKVMFSIPTSIHLEKILQ